MMMLSGSLLLSVFGCSHITVTFISVLLSMVTIARVSKFSQHLDHKQDLVDRLWACETASPGWLGIGGPPPLRALIIGSLL